MLRLDFDIDDLAALRFAISPAVETMGALRVIADPSRPGPHAAWLAGVAGVALEPPLQTLLELLPRRGYVPDFLTPPPAEPLPDIGSELAAIAATPPEVVRHELMMIFSGREMPAGVSALDADPSGELARIVGALARWHDRAIAPHWGRVHALLASEVALRARLLIDGGPELALASLHPAVRWDGGRLAVAAGFDAGFDLEGRGLLLVPSAFWPDLGPIVLGDWQPTLLYPAPGLELLWNSDRASESTLAAVLGGTRARLLSELSVPASTTELARRLGVTAPGVSQHLQRLRDAGLLGAMRLGREVHYHRTPLGDALWRTAAGSERPSPS